jgi:hypothetical protein
MFKKLIVAALGAFALAACASPKYVVSDVTRFHTLPAAPSGQTFVIATVSSDQSESLAYRKYADQVSAKLQSLGLRAASGPNAAADYVVTLRYSVRGPTPDVESRTGYWGFGAGYGYRHGPWGWGGFYEPGWDHYTDTRQLFVRRVDVDIYRGASYDTPKKERVFEGRALSTGQNGQLEPVMPYILDAMFKDFPGRSGETIHVSVQVPEEIANGKTSYTPSSRSAY